MVYHSVIRFQVKPGREAEFEQAFLKCGMLERPKQIDGFIRAELVRGIADPSEYHVLGTWESEASYAGWQAVSHDVPDQNALATFRDCLIDPSPGRLFKPVAGSD